MSISTALTALAEDVSAAKAAITAKGGTAPSGTADMADAIAAIPSGGITPSGSISITENGTADVTQYAEAEVRAFRDIHVTEYNANNTPKKLICNEVELPSYCFAETPGITEIEFTKVITKVNHRAFFSMHTLSEVTIPCVNVDKEIFYQTHDLETVVFPNLVRSNVDLFWDCPKIKYVDCYVIASIVNYFLENCGTVDALILRKDDGICTVNNNAFPSTTINYIYVPAALVSEYQIATNWSAYADKFRAIEDYPEITGGML